MHETTVKTKSGEIYKGYIVTFHPEKDCIELYCNAESKKFDLADLESVFTENERISINQIGTMDVLQEAKEWMVRARQYGWRGISKDTPKRAWE